MKNNNIGAVVLAPEPPKFKSNGEQLELLSPSTLLESALKPFFLFPLEPIVLVLGHDYHRILNMLKDLSSRVKVVIHRKPERGLTSALSVGLSALSPELRGIVIAKGDQVTEVRVLDRLLKAFEKEEQRTRGKKRIIVPLTHGKRGFPWVISSELRQPLTRFDGDFTLANFLKNHRKDVLTVSTDGL